MAKFVFTAIFILLGILSCSLGMLVTETAFYKDGAMGPGIVLIGNGIFSYLLAAACEKWM